MASVLSTAELKAQIETDLDTTTLQQIIDAVERDIREWAGDPTSEVEEFEGLDYSTLLRLSARAASITSVVEYTGAQDDPTKTTLAGTDYELSSDGWEVRRLSSSTHPSDVWGFRVVVTYVPATDTARRKQAAIALARLEITHTGYASESVGDWSAQSRELRREKMAILSRLDESLGS